MKQHIMSVNCHSDEFMDVIKDLHKKYNQEAGVEICARYGTRQSDRNPNRVTCVIWVYKTPEKSIYKGTHLEMYNQDVVEKSI